MNVRLARPHELSAEERDLWHQLQDSNPDLDSPFFCLEWIDAVAGVRPNLEVAVLEQSGEIVGFFPFQRGGGGEVGRPAPNRLSEFHGLIARPGLSFDAAAMLRQCRLLAWHFDHLIASQAPFQPHHWSRATSPYMDLSQGFEAYVAARRESGSSLPTEVARKSRKLGREVGPLRFELHAREDDVFRALLDWKTEQHGRTRRLEVLQTPWLIQLLETLRRIDTPRFSGRLSALYAGDHLVAVHLGLASAKSLHVWFPAFSLEYARFSPGIILLMEMARVAAAGGVRRIDLGKGPERYKGEFMTGTTEIAEGSVDLRVAHRTARRAWHGTKRWILASPRRAALARPLEWSRRWRQRRAFGS